MKYIWKINMIDGSCFLVYSKENDPGKFAQGLLPQTIGGDSISTFDCVIPYEKNGIKYNAVAIIGSKVASIEYHCK